MMWLKRILFSAGVLACVVFFYHWSLLSPLPVQESPPFYRETSPTGSWSPSQHPADTYMKIDDFIPCQSEAKTTGCQRRLPGAILVGAKKCGTGSLLHFLKFHPAVTVSNGEVHFFDRPSNLRRGIEWYRGKMGISRPDQLTIEKTPRYLVSSIAPRGIRDRISPKTKILVVLRDPVERAISDYAHEVDLFGISGSVDIDLANKSGRLWSPTDGAIYEIQSTFEQSVLDDEGHVKKWNALVNVGMYSVHMQMWLDVFPRDQILVLEAKDVTTEPLHTMIKIQSFLGLPLFYQKKYFQMNPQRGFYCFNASGELSCLGKRKGREHPDVDEDVIRTLRDFYEPYNQRLVEMLHQNFSWI